MSFYFFLCLWLYRREGGLFGLDKVGVSSLSKNPPVVSLSILSGMESDGGRRVWQRMEIQKQLEDNMVGDSSAG